MSTPPPQPSTALDPVSTYPSSTTASGSSSAPTSSSATPLTRSLLPALPPLLYGTAWKQNLTSSLVHLAISSGFRGIDTAAQLKHYREDLVGQAVETLQVEVRLTREELWLQTKFTPPSGQDWSGEVPYDRADTVETMVRKSFERSLKRLHPWYKGEVVGVRLGDVKGKGKTIEGSGDAKHEVLGQGQGQTAQAEQVGMEWPEGHPYIDSYLLHSPLGTLGETLEAWRTMEEFVEKGLVRQIGFSNIYDPTILHALLSAARVPPSILQNRWHHTTGHDVSLLPRLSPVLSPNDFPISPTGEGITYQPFWTLTGNPRLVSSPVVTELASKRGATPQQIVYAFVSGGLGLVGLRTTVLCGSTDGKHIAQAVEAVQLDLEEECEAIRKEVYGV